MRLVPENFYNWMPAHIYWRESKPFIDWCYIGENRFVQPFFDITIEQMHRKPFSLLFRHQTPLEFLGELHEQSPGLKPTGFIFHMSRCGSTLVAQMLAALDKNIVISEAPLFDSVLRAHVKNSSVTREQRIEWLKWIISAFGQKRGESERHYFIKFDSWSTLDMDLILEAFPDVPWVFLYRNPVEVVVSQMRQRGSQMIPGVVEKILTDLDLTEILQMPPEEYCARVLARICESAIAYAGNQNALFINYNQLPEALSDIIAEHFRVSYAPEEIAQMNEATRFSSKMPQMFFTPDSAKKREEASEAARRAAEKWINPLYERFENMRCELVS